MRYNYSVMTVLRHCAAALAVAFLVLLQAAAFYSFVYIAGHLDVLSLILFGATGLIMLPFVVRGDAEVWKKTLNSVDNHLMGKHIFWVLSPSIFLVLVFLIFISSF